MIRIIVLSILVLAPVFSNCMQKKGVKRKPSSINYNRHIIISKVKELPNRKQLTNMYIILCKDLRQSVGINNSLCPFMFSDYSEIDVIDRAESHFNKYHITDIINKSKKATSVETNKNRKRTKKATSVETNSNIKGSVKGCCSDKECDQTLFSRIDTNNINKSFERHIVSVHFYSTKKPTLVFNKQTH